MIAYIVPVYDHYDYAIQTVKSALATADDVLIITIDDCTPCCEEEFATYERDVLAASPRSRVLRLDENRGLTMVWNIGLELAIMAGASRICCTNSDVLFAKNWLQAADIALRYGWKMVGPVTNGFGTEHRQNVHDYPPHWKTTDDQASIDAHGQALFARHNGRAIESPVNGFCLLADTVTWVANRFDDASVFKPLNLRNSKGQINPTPTMTLQEYEFQRRLNALYATPQRPLVTAVLPGSFVFHYRSVTRGEKFGKGQAFRKQT